MSEEQFEYGGRKFTIRSSQDGGRRVVSGFEGDRRVTLTYGCDYITAGDLWHYLGESADIALRDCVRAEIRTRIDNEIEI